MKLTITLVLLLVVDVITLWAQPSVTLLTFESYTFPDKFDTEYGPAKVMDGFQWGGRLEFGLSEENAIELIYQHLDMTLTIRDLIVVMTDLLGINYILVGGTRYMPVNEKISGFGTMDLGVGGAIRARRLSRKADDVFDWI